ISQPCIDGSLPWIVGKIADAGKEFDGARKFSVNGVTDADRIDEEREVAVIFVVMQPVEFRHDGKIPIRNIDGQRKFNAPFPLAVTEIAGRGGRFGEGDQAESGGATVISPKIHLHPRYEIRGARVFFDCTLLVIGDAFYMPGG